MASSAKSLFLEAMSLDENNQLMLALSKYLEALIQFGSCLLEISNHRSIEEIQSKLFADQTKAAMQCLDRVFEIHQKFQTKRNRALSPPTFTLSLDTSPTSAEVGNLQISPNSTRTIRHTLSGPENLARPKSPMASAMINNQRLIAQFRDVIKQKQQEMSDTQIAQMETQLQKKITENLAVAEHVQRVAAIPPSSSSTLPPRLSRQSSGDGTVRMPRQKSKSKFATMISQRATLGPYDTLTLGTAIGDRWRSISGDRWMGRDQRRSSDGSILDESEFAKLLDDGDSDHEVPIPAKGALLPTIEEMFGVETCFSLSDQQRQQQQVFVELIYTERTHVRSMKVLQKLFYRPLSRSNILPRNFVSYLPVTFLDLVFANLDEVVDLHTKIGKRFKGIIRKQTIVNEIGHILIEFFDGEFSDQFKKAVAQFCQHQQFALEQLELRRQQDYAFNNMLKVAESQSVCHGFKLGDYLPTEMQRLSKYPLLLERLVKYADKNNSDEIEKLKRCYLTSQEILIYINSCKRNFENAKKLAEIQSRLDTTPFYRVQHPIVQEFHRFNMQRHGFVWEGQLRLMRMDATAIEIRGVLCDEILLLLTKRGLCADERLRLQFHDDTVIVGAGRPVLVRYSPIIKLGQCILKDAPSSNKEFYILSTADEVLLYHLVAPDPESKTRWIRRIRDQIDKLTKNDEAGSRVENPTESLEPLPSTMVASPSGDVRPSVVVVDDEDDDFAEFSDDEMEYKFEGSDRVINQ